jgi:small subunit ribosomal protein S1
MSDYPENDNDEDEEQSFAELLESYSAGMNEDLQVGDKINGEIISIGNDAVFIDTGTKVDGAVEKVELLDDKGELPHKLGDVLDLYVISIDEGKIVLSKGLSGIGGLMHLEEAVRDKLPVEGIVQERCKGGLNVSVFGKRAFCPISQIDLKFVENPEDYIGNTYMFSITQFEEDGKNIVVSRREILNREVEEASRIFFNEVSEGDILKGAVTRIEAYGAFVELVPMIEGMVHISEISWSKLAKPNEILAIGDQVKVKVLGVGKMDKSNKLKISLSLKQITGNPWDSIEEQFNPGDKAKGIITKCMDFGAFVEIAPGIEGLIHISEMSYTKRILKPEEVVHEGETVNVLVKDIDLEKKRISLSLKEAEGDPWLEVDNKYKIGQFVEGTIEKKERFGFFIRIAPGITGLLPKSKIAESSNPAMVEKLREGDIITVLIEEINAPDRKMTLGPGDSTSTDDWQSYSRETGTGLGSLGEKLQEALKSKK